jgi:2-oxoglutarate/2-oxoacid ferredoxin oxidoreductase subunit alpha
MDRKVVKISGENGMGLSSVGDIIQKSLQHLGYCIHSEREFPSTIKGGKACNNINISTEPIFGLSETIDICIGLDREGVKDGLDTLRHGGVLIHGFDRWNKIIKNLPTIVEQKQLKVFLVPAREIALENGGSLIMINTVLVGFLWKVLGLDLAILRENITKQFKKKPTLIDVNIRCLEAGYKYIVPDTDADFSEYAISEPRTPIEKTLLIDGNTAIGLGAIQAGMRNYFAYPMSPSTSILVYLASVSHQTGVVIKQAEDEITAVQMALGAMHAGSRALVATSGGGYDLMTETVSLAGMIETPLVVVDVQRPGPATGLPTWTAQGDVNMVIHSSHGEFSRVVMSCSDPRDCYTNIQHAFNLADEYQIPVIFLTEATIGMSQTTVPVFEQNTIKIKRGLVDESELVNLKSENRYEITDSGVSPRWLPSSSPATYFANGDEHWTSGEITEEADQSKEMIAKRLRKMNTVLKNLPTPEIFGIPSGADISFVGFGSTKNCIEDIIQIYAARGITVNYLHYTYLWPLNTDAYRDFCASNSHVYGVEGNATGQFTQMLVQNTGLQLVDTLPKWNGRPFYIEDISAFIDTIITK